MALVNDNIYEIKNVVFRSLLGLPSYQNPNKKFQPILGTLYDYEASTRFTVRWTHHDRLMFAIDGKPLVVINNMVHASRDAAPHEGDEWVVNYFDDAYGRYLYTIGRADSSNLVWTLNSSIEPLNKLVLAPREPNSHRQLWELEYYPY